MHRDAQPQGCALAVELQPLLLGLLPQLVQTWGACDEFGVGRLRVWGFVVGFVLGIAVGGLARAFGGQ